MINNFEGIGICKEFLKHNQEVLILDISEYCDHNQVVMPFIATVKLSDDGLIYFDCDDMLYSDDYRYIVVSILD